MNIRKIMLAALLVGGLYAPAALSQTDDTEFKTATAWQVPDDDRARWLDIFKTLANGEGWKVSAQNNDFVVESTNTVGFQSHVVGLPMNSKQHSRKSEGILRVTLRFSPQMEMKEWQRIQAENEAAATAHHTLKRKYRINQKFDYFWLIGENAKARADSYRAEAQKLKHTFLPQFFALDASITAFQSWHYLSRIDTNVESGQEAAEVLDKIRGLFGIYNQRDTSRGWFAYSEETKTQSFYPVKLRIVGE